MSLTTIISHARAAWQTRQRRAHALQKRQRSCPGGSRLRLEPLEDRRLLSVFTVSNTLDAGAGPLRQAILNADAAALPVTIQFNIPATDPGFAAPGVFVIKPLSALPAISNSAAGITIDGRTEAAFLGSDTNPFGPEIVLNGSLAGSAVSGLTITTSNNQAYGLDIQQFGAEGIDLGNGVCNSVIAGNYIGTDATGTLPLGNGFGGSWNPGVLLSSDGYTWGWAANTISGNTISGNNGPGIAIDTNGNQVIGNFIGTDHTGHLAVGNHQEGILISNNTVGNQIGGSGGVGSGNVISGNWAYGVNIDAASSANANMILFNHIGTDVTGTLPLGNGAAGVVLGGGGDNNVVSNTIAANNGVGIAIYSSLNNINDNSIGTNFSGQLGLGNVAGGVLIQGSAQGNLIGSTYGDPSPGVGNVISGNLGYGVLIYDSTSTGNIIAGNDIGTDRSGSHALGNSSIGVVIESASNQILRNVISANQGAGISIGTGVTDSVIQGNYIGTDATGTTTLGNNGSGIQIWGTGCQGNLIGSLDGDPALRNIISGNLGNGVEIDSPTTAGNIVAGNYIGTDASGSLALGNTGNGVTVTGSGTQVVKNVILGNGYSGVSMSSAVGSQIVGNVISDNAVNSSASNGINIGNGVTNSVIQGNFIGTDATGTIAWGNKGYAGIQIWGTGCTGNLIGSEDGDPALRNVISGNLGRGVAIDGGSTDTGNISAGNYIGTDVTGTLPLGNGFGGSWNPGVILAGGSTSTVLGNTISGNNGPGIAITTNDNQVTGNFIGTDSTGHLAVGNLQGGIEIYGTAQSNLIGSEDGDPALRNVISGNLGMGCRLRQRETLSPETTSVRT